METNINRLPKNKNFRLKFLVAILAILLIAWLLIWATLQVKKNVSTKPATSSSEQLINKIKKEAADYCKKEQGDMLQACLQGYYFSEAMASADEKVCASIENDEIQKNECLNNAYLKASLGEEGVSACEKISSEEMKNSCKDAVYQNLAEKDPGKGEEHCAKISNEEMKAHCINVSYYNMAVKIGPNDIEQAGKYCEQIKNDDTLKGFCSVDIKVIRI